MWAPSFDGNLEVAAYLCMGFVFIAIAVPVAITLIRLVNQTLLDM
jgi:hypothetical protein